MQLLKIDPSKYTHNVKKLKDDRTENIGSVSPEKLTWQLEESDSEIAKKRKGEFPSWNSNKRKMDSYSHFPYTESDKQKSTLDSLFPNYDKDLEIVPISDNVMGSTNKSSSTDFGKVNATSLKRKSVGKGAMSSPSKVVKSSKKYKTTYTETKTKTSDDGYDTGDTDDTDEIIAVTKKNRKELDSKKPMVQNEPKLPVNALQERLVSLAQTVTVPGHSSNKVARSVSEHSKSSLIDKDKDLKDRKMHINKANSSKIEDPPLMPFRGTKFLDDDDSNFEKSNNFVIAANNTKSTFEAGSDTDDSDFESLIKKTMNTRQQQTKVHSKAKKTFNNLVTSQSKDESDVNSDNNLDGSVDTDEILSSSSKSCSKSKSSKAIAKSKPKFTKSLKNLDEFSSGLMAANDRENSAHESGDFNETSNEESDFETLVKRELSKNEAKNRPKQKNKTKRKSDMVKESSDKADLTKELSDKKLSSKEYKDRSQAVKGSNTEKSAINSDYGNHVKAGESKDSKIDLKIGSKLLALSKTSVPEKTSEKDTNDLDPDKKRQETVRQRQKDYEAQKNVIQKALANLVSSYLFLRNLLN